MKQPLKLPMQFFAEEHAENSMEQSNSAEDVSSEEMSVGGEMTRTGTVNYEELLKTDKEFQSFLDRRINQAVGNAVSNAQEKWQKKHDSTLSEAERLATMTAEEKAEYFQKKYEGLERERTQDENAREMERQATLLFGEKNIPAAFLKTINFRESTAEDVKSRVEFLAGFEIYPKGTFESKLTDALNERLKQKPPETHAGSAGAVDYSEQLKEAQKQHDYSAIAYYTRLMNEQKQKG